MLTTLSIVSLTQGKALARRQAAKLHAGPPTERTIRATVGKPKWRAQVAEPISRREHHAPLIHGDADHA